MISCLCPTYGRTALLEESVQSFLMQDYSSEMEMVICNDLPSQTLHFDHPRVKVVNLKQRCTNLGEKRNLTAAQAKGDWLLTWGDDDIHLPWRISRIMGHVIKSGLEFCQEGVFYFFDHNGVHLKKHATAGAHVVKKSLFNELGGLAALSAGEDVEFNERVRGKLGTLPTCDLPPAFIYRWHSPSPHISGLPSNHYKAFGDKIDCLIAEGKEPKGEIFLRPQWRQNWLELIKS